MEEPLRDVLVISGNAAITAALAGDDLNVIPIDPTETPGWVEWASAAHLLMLDLGDADRAVDVVGDLRRQSVDVPVLIVAESVSDSPRLVALRLADPSVKTLTLPLTRERLLRAVGRTIGDAAAHRQAAQPLGPAAFGEPGAPAGSVAAPGQPRVEWPSFDLESFDQSPTLDWRTAITPDSPATADPPAQPVTPSLRTPAQALSTGASTRTDPALDLPPAPGDASRKHRLAPWARPRPGSAPPPTLPPVPSFGQTGGVPAAPEARLEPSVPQPPAPAPPLPADPKAAKAAAKAQAAADKRAAKARAAAEKAAAKEARRRGWSAETQAQAAATAQVSAEQAAEQEAAEFRDAQRALADAARAEKERLTHEAKAAQRAATDAARIERARLDAAVKAAAEADRLEHQRLEAATKANERAAADAARAERAHVEAEARASERAAAEVARAERARAEAEAKAATEASRLAQLEAKSRAKADADAARAAERAAAVAAKAAAEKVEADAKAAAAAAKAIERARAEAARIADAQARADDRAAQLQAAADAKAAAEAAKLAERAAAEAARADERARVVVERAELAQAKVDQRLAAEVAKAARAQAEVEAHQAGLKAREDAEQQRLAEKQAAEDSRQETIAKVQEKVQETKIRAEADRIVDDAVRKAEEDAEARALAARPIYYGPALESPGLGSLHQLMAMTDTLAGPAQVAEELAFLAMEHLECEAVAVIIPDGEAWTTASGIGIGRKDLRFRLSEEHWFIRQVLGREAVALIDDPSGLRDELSGVPLADRAYLVGLPMLDANSILIAARSDGPFDPEVMEVFAEGIEEYVLELAESLQVRDVAREIHDRGRGA